MNPHSTPAHPSSANQRRVSARIGAIAPSATLAVDAQAKALKAAGEPVIGFGAGEPDFATPAHIVDAAVHAANDPRHHRYSPAAGLPELRQAIAESAFTFSRTRIEPSQVLVTNGGKQAVYQSFATLLDPGDEVIVPAPMWTTYPEAISLAGGRTVPVFAGAEQNFIPTLEQLEAAYSPRTKALLVCSPSNPTGSVMTREQLTAVGRWALDQGIWVISDEIYQHLVYSTTFTSILDAVPDLADRTIIVNGVAKTFAMTGWRIGWMSGPSDIIQAATNLQSHLTSNVNNIAQIAALAALRGPMDSVEAMREAFDRRRRTMISMLAQIDGLRVPTPSGAFYAFPDVSALLGRTIAGQRVDSSVDLAQVILGEAKVALVPGEAFAAPGYVRLSYALSDDDLVEGVRRIQELLA